MAEISWFKTSVTGHTDLIGTPEYNMQLGMERAMVVRIILRLSGLTATGYLWNPKEKKGQLPGTLLKRTEQRTEEQK